MDIKKFYIKIKIFSKYFLSNLFIKDFSYFKYCPVCKNKLKNDLPSYSSKCIFSGARLYRYQCNKCDLIYGPSLMLKKSMKHLSNEYKQHYRAYSEGDSTDLEIMAFKCLNPSRNKVYLNYGAGSWSRTSKILKSQGYNIVNFDPHSTSNSEIISSYPQLLKYKFDGIFLNNVMEHFRYPIKELKIMYKLLKHNGKIVNATPCYEYLYEYTRFHFFFYLGKSKIIIHEKANFKNIKYISNGDVFKCIVAQKE